ncbi:MAG: glycoside hydrolase family 3 C-terminal domain-containing protein [Chloroflexi bacterium]|nr:glycoside hydrolase family 3 C-terminal domain-containing protein [Chloroflexota bacterium]
MGVEAKSLGGNFMGSVCINLLRHPAWGRAQETYGEDPWHLGEMGAALVRGIQRHAMACVKHFAANSIESSRFHVDVRISERTLREIYLPHFKRCVDEGVASVMSAYNKVNGHYCGHNSHLLRDILKKEWGFDGLVMSDFVLGIRNGRAANAGMDVEMPLTIHFGKRLMRLIHKGEVSTEVVDEAVLRILRQKIRFAQIGQPERYRPEAVVSSEHKALAREAAQKSVVLLKNEPIGDDLHRVLPVDTARVKRIAVIGRLAAVANIGDKGSSMARPPYVVTPLEGIRAAVPRDCEIVYSDGRAANKAVDIARTADMSVIIVGYTHRDEGEYMFTKGGDRDSLTLKAHDETLILKIVAVNPNTAVVLIGGSAIITESWREKVPALLMAWYPGMEGGNALADVLFGKASPCAKLPCVFPKSKSELPFFDKRAKSIEYGYFHGYRLMDKQGQEPAFHFGFGLSYTTFAYKNLQIDQSEITPEGALKVSVDVTNTGNVTGDEIVQLYAGYECSRVERPAKELKGFSKVHLEPGQTKRVDFLLAAKQTAYYDEQQGKWIVEPLTHTVYAGPSSRTEDLLSVKFRIRA